MLFEQVTLRSSKTHMGLSAVLASEDVLHQAEPQSACTHADVSILVRLTSYLLVYMASKALSSFFCFGRSLALCQSVSEVRLVGSINASNEQKSKTTFLRLFACSMCSEAL